MFDFITMKIAELAGFAIEKTLERQGFWAERTRLKCPHCGKAFNLKESSICPKCKKQIETDQPAAIIINRVKNPQYISTKHRAVNYEVYINNMTYGCIEGRQTVCFPLPYGTYHIHVVSIGKRKCNDPVITLSPEDSVACFKVFERKGFIQNSLILERVELSALSQK